LKQPCQPCCSALLSVRKVLACGSAADRFRGFAGASCSRLRCVCRLCCGGGRRCRGANLILLDASERQSFPSAAPFCAVTSQAPRPPFLLPFVSNGLVGLLCVSNCLVQHSPCQRIADLAVYCAGYRPRQRTMTQRRWLTLHHAEPALPLLRRL
jgi:hypothetical protein